MILWSYSISSRSQNIFLFFPVFNKIETNSIWSIRPASWIDYRGLCGQKAIAWVTTFASANSFHSVHINECFTKWKIYCTINLTSGTFCKQWYASTHYHIIATTNSTLVIATLGKEFNTPFKNSSPATI